MRRILAAVAATALLAGAAHAALPVGATAPDFSVQGAEGGKPFAFHLAQALKHGPVVLYFFPAAFTSGCTVEAHEFAEAADDYKKLGATLIGVTAGNIERITEFSVKECRNKFPVAADPGAKVAGEYKSTIPIKNWSDRTSYVIAPNGKILLSYSDFKPDQHVAKTLEAVKAYRAAHPA